MKNQIQIVIKSLGKAALVMVLFMSIWDLLQWVYRSSESQRWSPKEPGGSIGIRAQNQNPIRIRSDSPWTPKGAIGRAI